MVFDSNFEIIEKEPLEYCLRMIGGKWKPLILYFIFKGHKRFGVLYKEIGNISKQMLTKQLREMEKDGLLKRKIFAEVPPRVEYTLTDKGQELFPIIERMRIWGDENISEK